MLDRMQFARVIETSARVAATSSRRAKVSALAQTLRSAAAETALGEVARSEGARGEVARGEVARSEGARGEGGRGEAGRDEAGVAGPDVVEVVADYLAGRLPQRRVGVGWRSLRDLPEPQGGSTLTVTEVDAALTRLAGFGGAGSAAGRSAALRDLMARATSEEQTWLRGLLTGELRQGASDGVLQKAVAAAADVPESAVRRAVMLAGFVGPVAAAALAHPDDPAAAERALRAIRLEVGRPLRPMLASSAPDVAAAMAPAAGAPTDQPVALESKLDGIRIQAHLDRSSAAQQVRLFTRTLEEVTERLPEVVGAVLQLPADQAVLDGEVIAVQADGRPAPFQVTGARTASTADPERLREEVPLTTFLFDVLHRDGRDLVDAPAYERWTELADLAPGLLVPRTVTADPLEASAFFQERVDAGHEGVVVKALDAPYAAGRRGAGWVKVKPRHTLDLVVLAVEWGSGRRRGKLSNIHLGARDETTGGLVMLGKTFKGMTDAMLDWQTTRFTDLKTHQEGHVVHVRPEQVVEIAFDGVQRSRRYPGGVALRFARVLRYRDDKPVSEIDTLQRVRDLGG